MGKKKRRNKEEQLTAKDVVDLVVAAINLLTAIINLLAQD